MTYATDLFADDMLMQAVTPEAKARKVWAPAPENRRKLQ